MSELKDRIRELRKAVGLNQTDFGKKIEVKQGSVAGYESGARTPLDTVLGSMCRVYGANRDWLEKGIGDMFTKPTREEEIASFVGKTLSKENSSFQRRFLNMLTKLEESDWLVLEKMVLLMAQEKNQGESPLVSPPDQASDECDDNS